MQIIEKQRIKYIFVPDVCDSAGCPIASTISKLPSASPPGPTFRFPNFADASSTRHLYL